MGTMGCDAKRPEVNGRTEEVFIGILTPRRIWQ